MGAVRAGAGREVAHEAIKEHAVAVALAMREQGAGENDLLDRLAADLASRSTGRPLDVAIGEPLSFVGTAEAQVQAFVDQVAAIVARHPEAADYRPEPIL